MTDIPLRDSASVLNERLRELRDAGVIVAGEGRGYALAREGERLLGALGPLSEWAARWSARSR